MLSLSGGMLQPFASDKWKNIKCAEKFSILGLQIEYSRYQYDKMPSKNMRQQKYADPLLDFATK